MFDCFISLRINVLCILVIITEFIEFLRIFSKMFSKELVVYKRDQSLFSSEFSPEFSPLLSFH